MTRGEQIASLLRTLSQEDREVVLGEILDHFCVGCGAEGDFQHTTCDCLPHCMREESDQAAE